MIEYSASTTLRGRRGGPTRSQCSADGGPTAAATFLAVAAAAVCAPLNPAYKARELDFYLQRPRGHRLVITSASLVTDAHEVAESLGITIAELVWTQGAGRSIPSSSSGCREGLRIETTPATSADEALVLHTSGTTAKPKFVPLTHGRADSVRSRDRDGPRTGTQATDA